ncbi:hypothetical protein [Lacibacter cauensis]|uniref:hypothetical protein n=1 Tax=Lacibacter cauensis TaxID=510947 RepID=UPI0013151047|nr:hypothetical protein [Lacibacter cauensis]
MVLPLAIGAVVLGVPCTFQIPLSGHFSPVLAVVPIGISIFLSCSQKMRVRTFPLNQLIKNTSPATIIFTENSISLNCAKDTLQSI